MTKIVQNRQWLQVLRVVKWLAPFLIALILYKRFFRSKVLSFDAFMLYVESLDWYWFAMLPLFAVVNWLTEVYKWNFLINKVEPQTFRRSIKSVLSGVAVSQLLPYRTGEYLGRLAFVEKGNLLNAGILSVAGSFSQLLVTMVFGSVAFLILKPLEIPMMFLGLLLLMLLFLLFGYFYIPVFGRLKQMATVKALKGSLGLLNKQDMLRLMGLSTFRYLSFVLPYALLCMHYNLGLSNGLLYYSVAVACIYFLQTVSPSFILTDIAVRISVSAIVFSGSVDTVNGADHIPGMLIYAFNVALPMCAGALVLLLLRLRK